MKLKKKLDRSLLRSIIEVEVNKNKKGKLRYIGRFNRKG
tara:strand:+ start:385 stop:501 length:117 start_codon:yes stop_codon:yes gene_type:complete